MDNPNQLYAKLLGYRQFIQAAAINRNGRLLRKYYEEIQLILSDVHAAIINRHPLDTKLKWHERFASRLLEEVEEGVVKAGCIEEYLTCSNARLRNAALRITLSD